MLALYDLCHVAAEGIYIREVTEKANRINGDRGETHRYTGKVVGRILRQSLGFLASRWGNGYRVTLTSAVLRKIHVQAKGMGLRRVDLLIPENVKSGLIAGSPCDLCEELGLMVDHDGRKRQTIDDLMSRPRDPSSAA